MKRINTSLPASIISELKWEKDPYILFGEWLEQGIASSYGDKIDHKASFKMYQVMALFDAPDDTGNVEVPDDLWGWVIDRWKERQFKPAIGALRRLLAAIDKIVCADDYDSAAGRVSAEAASEVKE